MFNQIIPKIYSSSKRLVFSETICFFPKDGLTINLPVSHLSILNEITFQFSFIYDSSSEASSFSITNTKNNILKLDLTNFGCLLGSGTTTPIEISIGQKKYSMLLYAHRLEEQNNPERQLLHMTISMYGDAE